MLSSVTLDDNTGAAVTLHTDTVNGKRSLTGATGLRGIQNIRENKRVRPQAHGGINLSKYEDGRTVTLTGEIMSTVSIEDALAEWATVAAPMMQTLDSGPALLKWTEGATGNQLQRLVAIDGDLDPPFSDGQAVVSYQAQFFAEDPRAYSQTLQTVSSSPLSTSGGGMVFPKTYPYTFSSSGGGIVAFTNGGNRSTPATYRIAGMCVNPRIVLVGTGLALAFNGTIADGDYLEIDTAKRTIKLNSTANRYNFLDSPNSTWFELPPGTSNLQLVAGTFDGSAFLTVIGRSAWA